MNPAFKESLKPSDKRRFEEADKRRIAQLAGAAVALALGAFSLWQTRDFSLSAAMLVARWSAWVATAVVALAIASMFALASPSTQTDAERAPELVVRAWSVAFVGVVLAVGGLTFLQDLQSIRQQRLCANAANALRVAPERLRSLGVKCFEPRGYSR